MRRPSKEFVQWVRDRRGSAAVEFGLVAPVLCLLGAGAVDASRLVVGSMQVRAAAQAGADSALRSPAWDAAKVTLAVTGTATPGISASPAPALATKCVVADLSRNDPPGALCADQGTPGKFATISAEAGFTPVFPWPGVVFPAKLKAQAVVRLP